MALVLSSLSPRQLDSSKESKVVSAEFHGHIIFMAVKITHK